MSLQLLPTLQIRDEINIGWASVRNTISKNVMVCSTTDLVVYLTYLYHTSRYVRECSKSRIQKAMIVKISGVLPKIDDNSY